MGQSTSDGPLLAAAGAEKASHGRLEYDNFYETADWKYKAGQPFREISNLAASGALPPPPLGGRCALDLGCGLGEYTEALARLGFGRVVGIDYSQKAIELAESRPGRFRQVKYLLADFLEVDWEPGAYDFVLAKGFSPFNTAKLSTLGVLLDRLRQMLTPTGSIVITNPNRGCSGGAGWYSWSSDEIEEFRTLALRHFGSVDVRFYTRLSRRSFPILPYRRFLSLILAVLCRTLGKSVALTIVLRSPLESLLS